jgi:LacI family transcriptional regulator
MVGASRTNMKEVASRAGVAMSSVSRVLSDHPDVSPTMRARVLAAVEELGYHPNMLARSLRAGQTMSIGFVVGDISNPLLAEITLGAETALREAGYSLLLTNSENQPGRDAEHIQLLQRRRVDGLLLSLASETDADTRAALAGLEQPFVLIDRELPEQPEMWAGAALSDHAAGMAAAVHHLLELGHRRIGLILGQPMRFSRERRRGLEHAFAEQRLPPSYIVLEGHLNPEHGRQATAHLLDDAEPATAIVAGGNQLLIGVLRELERRELAPGRDVSLVTCDEIPLSELFRPPIAVIQRDNRDLGRRAAELLLGAISGAEPRSDVLKTTFVPRASCAPPAVRI